MHKYLSLAMCAVFLGLSCLVAHGVPGVRESILAGTWYPEDSDTLRMLIEKYFADARPAEIDGDIRALISPHAGYVYSGQVAAQGYKLLRGRKYDTVVVIAPSHKAAFPGVSVYGTGGYETPLGVMSLDMPFVLSLMEADPRIRYVPEAHAQEHAVEIQLPFLQTALPEAKLVPLVMGSQDPASCRELAKTLVKAIQDYPDQKYLLVASSDLSHYHPRAIARMLDQSLADAVGDFDAEALAERLEKGECEACGGGVAVTVMTAAKALGADSSAILGYSDSGYVTGDTDKVVGYLSAVFYKADKPAEKSDASLRAKPSGPTQPGEFSQQERELLHAVAREAVSARLTGREFKTPAEPNPHLMEQRGAFVTIKKDGKLRGCIGNLVGTKPLFLTIRSMAEAAAFSDPRFKAVSKEEEGRLEFEISVLTPLKRITDPQTVEVGKHGLLMRRGSRSGTLLPQVPGEWGWGREEFLRNTCRKAGLPDACWKDEDTEIYVYSAEVF